MTTMRVLAKGYGYELVQDLNSVLWMKQGDKLSSVNSPIEGIQKIQDPEIRKALAAQLFQGGK